MHTIRDFSRLRRLSRLMLCTASVAAFALPAYSRSLVPSKPSVEVNLNALRALEAPAAYQPAPITYAPPPAPTDRQVPAYQPGYTPPPAPAQRQVPVQQFNKPVVAATPVRKAAPKPKPVIAPKPAPVPAPVAAVPTPALSPVNLPEVSLPPPPAPQMPMQAPAPVMPSVPPVMALPVVTPPKVALPKPSPVPVVKPMPAPTLVAKPKPAPKVETPKPAPTVEARKPALVLPAVTDLPPPPLPPMNAPVLPKLETPSVTPVVPSTPLPAPKVAAPALPPMPTGIVNVPSVAAIRNTAPEPDISGLNFSKLPSAPTPTVSAPVPAAKKEVVKPAPVAVPVEKKENPLPLAPVAPVIPSLPPPPKPDTGALLIPVPKPSAPLPPTVASRLNVLNEQSTKEGIVSDKTVVQDHPANMAERKKIEADAAAKLKSEQLAAAEKLKQQAESDARLKKAQAEIDAKSAADAKLKAETELAAAKKTAEDKAKADAEAAKKAALKLPPAALPPPMIALPVAPDPLARSAAPVKLEKSDIAALPAFNNAAPVKPALPVAPVLPKAPTAPPSNPDLPKLPTLTIPGTQPDKPLPSLTAITGDDAPSTADIMLPKDGVDSAPLGMPSAPSMPSTDELLSVKRELPEINVGGAAPPSKLPVVTSEKKSVPALPGIPSIGLPPAAVATAPALPSIPPAPTITPKTEEKVMVASAPTVSTSGNLETSITFGANSSALGDSEKSALSAIADKARKGNKKVRIVGYAAGDADKSAVARKTAFARANIIRAFLLSKGMSDAMIHAQALGNQVPADKADIFLQ